MDDTDFSALLCARLCHDLISPVSAARNGIAMAQDESDPEMRAEAMALTADGLTDAVDKLKVYRIAYGMAGPGTTLSEARKATQGLYARGRVEVDWPDGGTDLGPEEVRLLVNLVLLGAPDVQAVLDGETSEGLTPRQIQAALTIRLATRQGRKVVHEAAESKVTLTANTA